MELHIAFSPTTNILISIFFFFCLIKLFNRSKAKNLPPGPWKLPIIGSMHHLATGSLPQYTLSKLSKRYGPLMHLKLGEIDAVVVSTPEMAKLFLKTHEIAFGGRPSTLASDIITYNKSEIAFSPCNAHWQKMRKICVLELLSNKRVKSYSSIRDDEVSDLVAFIRKSVGSSINLSAQLFSLTSSITCRAAFGEEFPNKSSLISFVNEFTPLMSGFDLWDFFPSLNFLAVASGMKSNLLRIHKKIDMILEDIINKRREYNRSVFKRNGEGGNRTEDLLDVLLRLQQENDQKFPVTDNNIKAIIIELFVGGTETSASVVEWAMSELIKNPRVMEKVQCELRRGPYEIKNVEERNTHKLHYLNMVIKETLRLHPPIPLLVPRECTESCEINGCTIHVKTKVIVNAWGIGRDPEFWEDADKFIPERFEKNMFEYNGNNFEYIPFGAGRRICPGVAFGGAIIELVLAQLLYHFNWKIPDQMTPEELDMTYSLGITATRRNPLHLVAEFNHATRIQN